MYLGIEIGGTKLQVGAGRGDGRLVALRRRQVVGAGGAAGILEAIAREARDLAAEVEEPWRAVGIGFGGPVDAARGLAITSHQVAGWDRFPLAEWARETLGAHRAVVENDADTAALGEARFGAGRGLSPVLYATLGSGIGGGLILDGRIYRGAGAGATELGHLMVEPPGEPGAGPLPLERIASGWAVDRAARDALEAAGPAAGGPLARLAADRGGAAGVTAREVAEAARQDDPLARAILGRAVEALGIGLAHAVTLLAPRRIVLGGGLSLLGEDLLFAPLRAAIRRRAFPLYDGLYDVVPAALGEEVVVHGALALAAEAP